MTTPNCVQNFRALNLWEDAFYRPTDTHTDRLFYYIIDSNKKITEADDYFEVANFFLKIQT